MPKGEGDETGMNHRSGQRSPVPRGCQCAELPRGTGRAHTACWEQQIHIIQLTALQKGHGPRSWRRFAFSHCRCDLCRATRWENASGAA